jgi:hypothetical protein
VNIERFALKEGDLVLEVGRSADCDESLRAEIISVTKNELLDEDSQEVVDAVILWWREEDGDLIDALVDAQTYLTENGPIWLLTPKVGRDGHVEASDIQDAVPTAGLSLTTSFAGGNDWVASKILPRKLKK